MKSIQIYDEHEGIMIISTNQKGYGLWEDERQIYGTCDTPRFDTPYQLSRWYKKAFEFKRISSRMVRNSAEGWE